MAAEPKRKISTYRKGKRYASKKKKPINWSKCPKCKQKKRSHFVCPNCQQ